MGAGRDHQSPWLYNHAAAYTQMRDRVTVVGFVDRVQARAEWAVKEWQLEFGADLFAGDHLTAALEILKPDIVSVCTPPSDREEILDAAWAAPSVKGIWCEKPYGITHPGPIPTQVNFIRRFDRRHREIADRRAEVSRPADLFVICANDIHTTVHFTDLANFWSIDTDRLHYIDFHGPALYMLREEGDKPGRYAGWNDQVFVGGGVETGFMEAALANLLDAVEGKAELISPASSAIEAEAWAREILNNR